jgi:hypothetical protein
VQNARRADVERELVRTALDLWKSDTGLKGVHDSKVLDECSIEEQTEWRSLSSEVDALLARAVGRPS